MNVIYTDKAKESGTGLVRLEQATRRLEEVATRSATHVTAEWDRKEDPRGRALYNLHLRYPDGTGEVEADFAPDELRHSDQLRDRLRTLWGDLLRVRSHKLLARLIGTDGGAGD